ncbi:MAG: hypothetical protein KC635_00360 [Myxococcales bacterium]|nr:hypothetical protein [Myxococcales bacterium]MCB9736559.1 hypothetical protein [Deltaproteobacteria bacterium]
MATFHEIETPDEALPEAPGAVPPGVPAIVLGGIGLALAALIPYAVVAASGTGEEGSALAVVAKMRPWYEERDPVPFTDLFQTSHDRPERPELAAALKLAGEPGDGEDGGEEPLAPIVVDTSPPPVETAPAEPPTTAPGPDANGSAVAPSEPPPTAKPVDPITHIAIPEAAWEGITAEIEDPNGAMGHFYEALAKTALKEHGAVTRISQWGDSSIAADGMSSAARRLLQRQFGDAGHGWSLIAAGTPWYKRKDIAWTTTGWHSMEFIRKDAPDGRYGYGGVAATGYQGATATWKTVDDGPVGHAASRFEVHYLKDKRLGKLALVVDDEEKAVVETAADAPEDAVAVVEVPDGPHTFKLKNVGGGLTRVYGAVIERTGVPGVVYDGIGVVGARIARQLWIDEAHHEAAMKARDPDLVIFTYGGNALVDKTSSASYKADYVAVLKRYREALPDASCVVMSPLDHDERYGRGYRTVARLHLLMKVQREAALENGCAWFSIYDAMGGDGSIGAWFEATPRLAEGDLAHPSAAGSRVLGSFWYKALMKGFAGWIAARKAAAEGGAAP